MLVRLCTGPDAGTEIEVDDSIGRGYLASGRAELVETAEVGDVLETPERPKGRRTTTPRAETR